MRSADVGRWPGPLRAHLVNEPAGHLRAEQEDHETNDGQRKDGGALSRGRSAGPPPERQRRHRDAAHEECKQAVSQKVEAEAQHGKRRLLAGDADSIPA